MHEVVVAYCCYNFINKEEEKQLRGLFRFLDHDNKNRLSMNDFSLGFKDANIMVSTYELKKIINILDNDGSNLIEYQEFLRAACDKNKLFKDENLKAVFGVIDKDKKGYLSSEDIQKFVLGNDKKNVNRSTIKGCYAQIGMKKNSRLTFEQFCNIIRNNTILQNDSSDLSNSEDEVIINNINLNKNTISSKNLIQEIENKKMYYNMTEGDEIIDQSKHKRFKRINTTKI